MLFNEWISEEYLINIRKKQKVALTRKALEIKLGRDVRRKKG